MDSSTTRNEFVDGRVLFGVPKKGRLYEKILKILEGAGLDFVRLPRLDVAKCNKLPITIVFLPAHDIAEYIAQGNVDIGITGEDMIAESGLQDEVNVLLKLGFGKCRLSVQAPVGTYKSSKELSGKRIVTSFPKKAREYFSKFDTPDRQTDIRYVSGSVEVACSLGLADAVVDLVETGTTMRAAGLDIVEDIMTSEAVLLAKPFAQLNPESHSLVQKVFSRIEGYLIALKFVMVTYNCPKDKLEQASIITPGQESPTVTPQIDPMWVGVSALIKASEVSEIMDELSAIGCRSILIFQVSNCRFPGKNALDVSSSPPTKKQRRENGAGSPAHSVAKAQLI